MKGTSLALVGGVAVCATAAGVQVPGLLFGLGVLGVGTGACLVLVSAPELGNKAFGGAVLCLVGGLIAQGAGAWVRLQLANPWVDLGVGAVLLAAGLVLVAKTMSHDDKHADPHPSFRRRAAVISPDPEPTNVERQEGDAAAFVPTADDLGLFGGGSDARHP